MRTRALLAILVALATTAATAQSEYDRHVAFDNTLSSGSFYYSRTYLVAPSELEMVNNRMPVDETHFLSPPNALRLKWKSNPGGDWGISLTLGGRWGISGFSGKNLYFWC